jgi:hypothetical protein
MSTIKPIPISLSAFGYIMKSSNEVRRAALKKAVNARCLEMVIERLYQIQVNVENIKQTDEDILYLLSTCDEDDDKPTIVEHSILEDDNKNDRFIECMKLLNGKLYKATLDKDHSMIYLMVTSMTNVIKSTL